MRFEDGEQCADCRYYYTSEACCPETGLCLYNTPVPVFAPAGGHRPGEGMWPLVDRSSWCGRFAPGRKESK